MQGEHTTKAVRRLGVRFPIVQGPFGGGLSTARLTATVSNMGGLGSFGAQNVPPHDIGRIANAIRLLTSQPFAVNLWVSDRNASDPQLTEAEFERLFKI